MTTPLARSLDAGFIRAHLDRWARYAAAATLAVGCLTVSGWWFNVPFLAQMHSLSALLPLRGGFALVFAGALMLLAALPAFARTRNSLMVMGGIGLLAAAFLNDLSCPALERISVPVLLRNLNEWNYLYRDRLGPTGVYNVFTIGLVMLLFPARNSERWIRDLLGGTSTLVFACNLVLMMAFLYGDPLPSPAHEMPATFPGCLGGLLIGLCLLLLLGETAFPLRPLLADSIDAILWRTFLPVGVVSIFMYVVFTNTVLKSVNSALASFISMLIVTLVVSVLVVQSSSAASDLVQRALRESERRYSLLVQSLREHAVYLLDVQGRIVTWDKSAEDLHDLPGVRLIGRHIADIYTDQENAKGTATRLLQTSARDKVTQGQSWHRRAENGRFWAEDVVSAIYDDQQVLTGFSVVTRDITFRRQAEMLQRDRVMLTEMLQLVSVAANEADDVLDVIRKTLQYICVQVPCALGRAWEWSPETEAFTPTDSYVREGPAKAGVRKAVFQRSALEPAVVNCLTEKRRFCQAADLPDLDPRTAPELQAVGLSLPFYIPVLSKNEVSFVLEFMLAAQENLNPGTIAAFEQVGVQLGHVIERERATAQLVKSLREKEVLLKEIHHRVKNNLQIISSLLRLQTTHVDDPAIRDLFRESQDRVRSMAMIHEFLYQSADVANIRFADYVRDLTASLFRSYGVSQDRIRLTTQIEDVPLSLDAAIPCGLILTELVSNVLKYAFPDPASGELLLSFRSIDEEHFEMVIRDNGAGLPAGFNLESTESLGLRLVQALSRQLRGKLNWASPPGTEWRLTIPKHV